jgi:phenylacetate-CoA ligase
MTLGSGRLSRFALRKTPCRRLRVLSGLIRHAARDVPFYAEIYREAGVRSEEVGSLEDLGRLPIARRERLLAARHLRCGADPERLVKRSTCGSTGEPLTVYASPIEAFFRKAALLASFGRATRLRFPLGIADVGAYTKGRNLAQALGLVRVDRIFRSLPIAEQALNLSRIAPDVVVGRPTSLVDVAREAHRLDLTLPRPRAVICFGEMLHPPDRGLLEEAFRCRVADYYNCEEVGNVAWECPNHPDRMHVNGDTSVVEVVDDDGRPLPPGESGHVLLTNLTNWTMPFIRYAIRDRATNLGEGRCECGFVGASMRLLEGRDEDFFLLPDGRRVSPRSAYGSIANVLPVSEPGNDLFYAIRRFQIVQEAPDLVAVYVVPGPGYSDQLWSGVEASAKSLHPSMRVRIQCVDELRAGPGGKFRQVLSLVGGAGGGTTQ